MAEPRISIVIQSPDVATMSAQVLEADRLAIPAAWATTAALRPDALTVFAGLAMQTRQIVLGSAIVPTWPRNPLFLVQQIEALEGLAPGRFRVGVGPSTEAAMRPFGVEFRKPMQQVREYLTVVRGLLREGSVDFTGEFVRARARIPQRFETPLLISALQEGAFALCGELADGAITWMCPPAYILRFGLPALQRAAAAAGRTTPRVVLHAPVCVAPSAAAAREAVQKHLGAYGKYQFYEDMFAKAGFPGMAGGLSDALIDDLAVYGSEAEVASRLVQRVSEGFDEVMAQIIPVGEDEPASVSATLAAVARAAQQLA